MLNAVYFLTTPHVSRTPQVQFHTPHFFSEVVRLLQMCIFMHMHCEVYNDTDFPVHKNTSALEFTEFLIKLVIYKASYELLWSSGRLQ